jgi:casein kinase II subunit beta
VKPKKFHGLLEWVLEQDGHDFLVEVDRSFIKNRENLIGLKEKLSEELNLKDEKLDDRQFNMYIKHLYKSVSPSKESLADEKYFMFLQDIVDVYGMIHNRYIRTPEGK